MTMSICASLLSTLGKHHGLLAKCHPAGHPFIWVADDVSDLLQHPMASQQFPFIPFIQEDSVESLAWAGPQRYPPVVETGLV